MKRFIHASMFIFLISSWTAMAQMEFTIVDGVDDPVPVAFVPFGWQGAGQAPYDVAQVVQDDLVSTGRFEAYPRSNMLEMPTAEHEVDFADWALLGVEVVVVGNMQELTPGNYQIGFQAFDIVKGTKLLGYNVTAPTPKLRSAGHYIADLVYEAILGERGVFSTRIAYVTMTDTRDFELVVADADGENAKTVVRSSEPIMSPSWSPDSQKLAYVIFENNGSAIYEINIFTGERRRLSARNGVNGAPVWSPNGQKMAMTLSDDNGNLDIYVLDLNTSSLDRLTTNSGIDTEPAWSLDGRSIYFNSDRSNGPQIYEVAANGNGKPARLTFEGNYNARPRLAPDGKSLAIVHNDRGSYRIGILDLTTGGMSLVSEGKLDESPSFAPNGSTLIYANTVGQRGGLATVSSDGQIKQQLRSKGIAVREPVWSPFPLGTN